MRLLKKYLNSSDITCLDYDKHISQNHNYESKCIFCLLNSLILGIFFLFELDKVQRLDFSSYFGACFSFLLGIINQANLIIKVIY